VDANFRTRRQEHRLWDYERLTGADNWHQGKRRLAEATIAGKWEWKGHPAVALEPPVDWDGICAESRSWNLALHSWEPLAAPLSAYQHLKDRAALEFALALAADWLRRFPSTQGKSPFAWYDLATGSRAYRLAYMLDVAARDPAQSDGLVSLFLKGLILHAKVLADNNRYASHSNHAIYQVIGQLAVARRFPDVPELVAAGTQGRERLDDLLDAHFTEEGIHREHSPHYHHSALIPIRALGRTGLVSDSEFDAFLERSEEALAWFVTPAGNYAMLGDTSARIVTVPNVDQFTAPAFRLALSEGRTGEPPSAQTRGFPQSGYVVFKDRWPRDEKDFSDSSYLAQTCAFHSRVHKHADDLSFVWHDRGCEILTDAGRFGYVGKTKPDSDLASEGFWYADPRRVYVESTCAHNTVEIDRRSNPRCVKPYGSALTQWGERGEIRFSESLVNWADLSHMRLLLFRPRKWLLVIDSLADSAGKAHNLTQRFHLAPEIDLIEPARPDVIAARLPTGEYLHGVPLLPQVFVEPTRGVEGPQLLGWISRRDGELNPQWTVGWQAPGVSSHNFASLFCFTHEPPETELTKSEMSIAASTAQLQWKAGRERHSVAFKRIQGQSFEIKYCANS
jgi:hypothetical protein